MRFLSLPQAKSFVFTVFLTAGAIIQDATVKEFDVCLEVSRYSMVCALIIFKYHSLLKFDFLVDIIS